MTRTHPPRRGKFDPVPDCCLPDCADPAGGYIQKGQTKPKRYWGGKFHKPGWLCYTCWQTLYRREYRMAEKALTGQPYRARPGKRRPI